MSTVTYPATSAAIRGGYLPEGRTLSMIAMPLVMASLVHMSISITDVVMMGWLGADALAAGAVVSDFFSLLFYLAAGINSAMAPLISQARGAGATNTIRSIAQQAFLVGVLMAIPGALIVYNADAIMLLIGVKQEIIEAGIPYSHMMAFTFVSMTLFNVLHHFLSAHELSRVIFIVTLAAMPVNGAVNYLFMYGVLGLPAMGLAGVGLSSALTTSLMFTAMLVYATSHRKLKHYGLLRTVADQPRNHLGELLRIGVPIAVSNLGELGVFLLSTVTMGIFGTEALAAHAVALRTAGVVFALPNGLSQAVAVRTAYAAGAGDARSLRVTMHTALGLGALVGGAVTVALLCMRSEIAGIFLGSDGSHTLAGTATLFLTLLAAGELFSNLGAVGSGILRGVKDSVTPMICSLAAFWGVGFAGGWSLAFVFGYDGVGIWIGLTAATIVYGLLIAYRLVGRFSS